MTHAKIDFNTADKGEIEKIINPEAAQKIIDHRKEQKQPDDYWAEVDKQFKEVSDAGKSAFVINKYTDTCDYWCYSNWEFYITDQDTWKDCRSIDRIIGWFGYWFICLSLFSIILNRILIRP